MNIFRMLVAVGLWAGITLFASAQSINQGLVFDAQTKEPLPGVTLVFPDGKGASTDANGHFLLPRDSHKVDRKSTRLNSSHSDRSRMPSSA